MSTFTPRPNCCDNCTIGLCSWKLSDLYENIDDNGMHDFGDDSKILLESIKCLQLNGLNSEKHLIKKFLIGKFDSRLRPVLCERYYKSGRMQSDGYWLALMEQLTLNHFIDVKMNSSNLTLSAKAEEWLQNSGSLPLKAIGQMYEFFSKKQSTPLVVRLNQMNHHTVTRAVSNLVRKSNVLSVELLKQILNQVRDAIAIAKNISENEIDSIASTAALDKMVKVKPQNLDEFRYAALDAFTDKKLNKYGPTFVNVISKFMVRNI